MKITKRHLRGLVKEAQFGRFTGGAAPLDVPMRDSGPVPKDQLHKLADIYMNDMGMSPEEVLAKPEFVEQGITDLRQLEENKMKITKRQLRRIIREAMPKDVFNLRSGDPVRHRDEPELGIGRVVAKGSKRDRVILVKWEAGFTRRHDPSSLVKER